MFSGSPSVPQRQLPEPDQDVIRRQRSSILRLKSSSTKRRTISRQYIAKSEAANHAAKGTGLGLPICKSIVNLMNGDIGLEDVNGKTLFWFLIPLLELESQDSSAGNPFSPVRVKYKVALSSQNSGKSSMVTAQCDASTASRLVQPTSDHPSSTPLQMSVVCDESSMTLRSDLSKREYEFHQPNRFISIES